jgi:hypothetical protein
MEISEDVRKFPSEQRISEEGSLQLGFEQKAKEFVQSGQVYQNI